jgi:membrane protease YdiL (CAAX protease family)
MSELVVSPPVDTTAGAPTVPPAVRRRRLFALALVLSVSFLQFIYASFYYLFGGKVSPDQQVHSFRVLGALIIESTSLLLLWYVVSERDSSWRAIGWSPVWKDLRRGLILFVTAYLTSISAVRIFQAAYKTYTGHYLQPRSLHGMVGSGISFWSVAFVVTNPFFEELIVRGYTMSEVMDLGGSPWLAIVISVSLQMSYHFYQGLLRSIMIAATFIVFSIYFAKTRRIAPLILAHFCFDAYALVRGTF